MAVALSTVCCSSWAMPLLVIHRLDLGRADEAVELLDRLLFGQVTAQVGLLRRVFGGLGAVGAEALDLLDVLAEPDVCKAVAPPEVFDLF